MTQANRNPNRTRKIWIGIGIGGIAILAIAILAAILVNTFFSAYLPWRKVAEPLPHPAVTIQKPPPVSQVELGESFPVFVYANDEQGVIRLDLWVDDTLVLSQTSPDASGLFSLTLSYPMVAARTGSYTLYARAFNSQGEMGESNVHYVNVNEAQTQKQEYAQYQVQEGDTLESIAAKAGTTADEIQQANSHISGGQVKSGQVTLLPVSLKRLVQGAISVDQGALPGSIPDNLPGVLPAFQPPSLPPEAGSVQLIPDLYPKDNILPPNIGAVLEPSDLKASTGENCRVDLSWVDNASDETGYEVHRMDPGKPSYDRIAQLTSNSTHYQDRTPTSGTYHYYVAAIRTKNGQTSGGGSRIVQVSVTTSTNCQVPVGPKRLFFQPLEFRPKDGSIQKVVAWVTIDGFASIRVPREEQEPLPVGDWSTIGSWAIPLPETVLMKPGDGLTLEVRGSVPTSNGTDDLRGFSTTHWYDALADPNARSKIWTVNDADAEFIMSYHIWLEDWQWGGKIANPDLPAPTDLTLVSDDFEHDLKWQYDPKFISQIDGFILYGEYACPDGLQEKQTVTTYTRIYDNYLELPLYSLPANCACSYKVSAFGPQGESKLSTPARQSCYTKIPEAKIQVEFETFQILQDDTSQYKFVNQPGTIILIAGETSRSSTTYFLEEGRPYSLQNLDFNNEKYPNQNNRIVIPVSAGKSANDDTTKFRITHGFQVEPNICSQTMQVFELNDYDALFGTQRPFTVTSSCGPGCTCKMTGNINAVTLEPDANVVLPKNIGESCASDSECDSHSCVSNLCVPETLGFDGDACFANNQCASEVCECFYTRSIKFTFACPAVLQPFTSGACVGPTEDKKWNSFPCTNDGMCASGNCDHGICAPKEGLGQIGDYCHNDNQCFNGFCLCPNGYDGDYCKGYQEANPGEYGHCYEWPGSVNGETCQEDDDCQSRHCAENKCAPIDYTGLLGDYCHHQNHCLSRRCSCPEGQVWDLFLGFTFCKGYEDFSPSVHGTCEE